MTLSKRYHQSVSKVVLTGGGASMKGLLEEVKTKTKIGVEIANPFSRLRTPHSSAKPSKKAAPNSPSPSAPPSAPWKDNTPATEKPYPFGIIKTLCQRNLKKFYKSGVKRNAKEMSEVVGEYKSEITVSILKVGTISRLRETPNLKEKIKENILKEEQEKGQVYKEVANKLGISVETLKRKLQKKR